MKQELTIYRERLNINQIFNDIHKKPTAFNGMLNITPYRITIEEIEETKEVKLQRLISLYKKSDNWHDKENINRYFIINTGIGIIKYMQLS